MGWLDDPKYWSSEDNLTWEITRLDDETVKIQVGDKWIRLTNETFREATEVLNGW